jgi:UPF0755 protein
MTEYGRDPGSQPWNPEDPLAGPEGPYGDQSWAGQQAPTAQDPYPQEPYPQEPYAQDPYAHQQYPQGYPQPDQQQPQWNGQQAGYPQQPQQPQPQYGAGGGGGWDGTYGGMDPHDPYAQPQPAGAYGGGQPGYNDPQSGYPPQDQSYGDPAYGQGPQDPAYGQGQQPRHEPPYGQGRPDPSYGQQQAQPVPQQQPVPQTQAMPQVQAQPQAPVRTRQAPAPEPFLPEQQTDEPRHAFFDADADIDPDTSTDPDADPDADPDTDADDDQPRGRDRRGKRRNGMACLVVTVVLAGAVGGGGYFGYQFWQSHFGAPPDFSGQGSGQVDVEIPEGAGGIEIGGILRTKGVVKSSGAFVDAVNSSGKIIQPGTYTLRQEMSAAAAVKLMTDPASLNALIVTEGMRNVQIYAAIDKKIGLKAGTTKGIAKKQSRNLGLPGWADDNRRIKDPLEGFLFPSRYSVGKNAKPADVLRQMVTQAKKSYAQHDVEGKAAEMGLKSPLQLVTVASLVQAEGVTHEDFRKMAEVVYNRLKPGNSETFGKLEFDSTYNYVKNQSKIDISLREIKALDNPYNTYFYKGLPPGPIGNPGDEALTAAVKPTGEGWYYFISLDGKTTQFTKTYAEHKKLVDQFNARRNG